jgi:hypothetical protein
LDRVVISGSIPGICYADGMSSYLRLKGIRILDYARWAEPLRDQSNSLVVLESNSRVLPQQQSLEA